MGGEITWECLSNGNFRFILKVYRECGGILYPTTGITMNSNSPAGNIQMRLWPNATQGVKDISPQCNPDPMFTRIKCYNTVPAQPSNQGAVEEWTYTSDQMYPSGIMLNGIPPPTGWVFSYTSCCRNPCNNINLSNTKSWFLRAVMYPYTDPFTGVTWNNYPCWDDSPTFFEKPSTVICLGYPFTYNHNAHDKQLDSLSYDWDTPLEGNINTPITGWNFGYSYNSPLPSVVHNPNNVPATVNPNTGEISFTSYTQGAFITVTRVTAYRCGIKIAEIFREMQVVLLQCGTNFPPVVTAPFFDSLTMTYSLYIDTVYAGAVINFYFTALDTIPLILANGDLTTVTLTASGSQFGTNYSSTTTGCINPPCATLTPQPPISQWMGVNTAFYWQTTCNHLETNTGCGGTSNIYNFVIKTQDDFCPAPGINIKTITIVILNPILNNPLLKCISVENNGDITINWIPPDTTNIPNFFDSYLIYHSTTQGGGYTLIDSIFDYNINSYTHVGVNGNNVLNYYYVITRSGCFGKYFSPNTSDTLNNIILTVNNINNDVAGLTWNTIHVPYLNTSYKYYNIYRESSPNNWVLIDTTSNLFYHDTLLSSCGLVNYKVTMEDSTGCISVSSIDNNLFQSAVFPIITCISTERDGSVTIEWLPITDSITSTNLTNFLIYKSYNKYGQYQLIDSTLNITYTDIDYNSLSTIIYYYIKSQVYCDGYFLSSSSDTINTILLSINKLSQESSELYWNDIKDSLVYRDYYNIYREYPPLFLNLIDTVHGNYYTDTLKVCDDSIYYRVTIENLTGCFTRSNFTGEHFYDDIAPELPLIDTVSIDIDRGIIGWQKCTSLDVMGYIIYNYDNYGWTVIDTIWDINVTSYTDIYNEPCLRPISYTITSFDSCYNESDIKEDNIHNTVFLNIVEMDPCNNSIKIEWTEYINMKPHIDNYQIYVSVDTNDFVLLTQTNYMNFSHDNLTKDDFYCYYIKVLSIDGKSSTSCVKCRLMEKAKIPDFLFIRYVTVENNEVIKLLLYVDTSAVVKEYLILRSLNQQGPYEIIDRILFKNNDTIIYRDRSARFNERSYYYNVIAIDTCGDDSYIANTSRSIFLDVINNNYNNILYWNDYLGWEWSYVDRYYIYKYVDGVKDPIPITTFYNSNSYIDDVFLLKETSGNFEYEIEAIQGFGIPDFKDVSLSNRFRILQPSKSFIPNSFSPKGYNDRFKPIVNFIYREDYEFIVFNRWGEQLFKTNDVDKYWDGKYNNEYVPLGVYVYTIKVKTSTGDYFIKKGTITVIY
jgi:gliding motility-associated-like protein